MDGDVLRAISTQTAFRASANVCSGLGGGLWHPEAQALASLRQTVDQHPQRLKSTLMIEQIREEFLGGAPKDPKEVMQAFVSSTTNAETALKTKPKVSTLVRNTPYASCPS